MRIDRFEPAIVPETQHHEIHYSDPPAIRDRPQPLEREVRIRLTRQERLERPRRSELERIATGRNRRPGFSTRSPNAESANRVDSDRSRMPTVRRQPSGGRRSPAAIIAFPASTDAAAAMFAPRRTSVAAAVGDDFSPLANLSDYNAQIRLTRVDITRRDLPTAGCCHLPQSLPPRGADRRGGMGEVYRAVDTRLQRPVAVKLMRESKGKSASPSTGSSARHAPLPPQSPQHRRRPRHRRDRRRPPLHRPGVHRRCDAAREDGGDHAGDGD